MTGSLGGPLHCFSHLLNSLSSAGTAAVTKTSMMTHADARFCFPGYKVLHLDNDNSNQKKLHQTVSMAQFSVTKLSLDSYI